MATSKELMLAGELYVDDEELSGERERAAALVAEFNSGRSTAVLDSLLGGFGAGSEIVPPFHVDYGYPTSVGSDTFINLGLVILDCAPVTIGSHVLIASNVQLLAATHPVDPDVRHSHRELARPVSIGDGAWLGAGAIVLPGVSVGRDTVVGAGAVVVEDLPDRVVATGNPARVIRSV